MTNDDGQRDLDRELAAYFIELLNDSPSVRAALADAVSGRTTEPLARIEAALSGLPASLQMLAGDLSVLRNMAGRQTGGPADPMKMQATLEQMQAEIRALAGMPGTAGVQPRAADTHEAPTLTPVPPAAEPYATAPMARAEPPRVASAASGARPAFSQIIRSPAAIGAGLALFLIGGTAGFAIAERKASIVSPPASQTRAPAVSPAPAPSLAAGWKRLLEDARRDDEAELARKLKTACDRLQNCDDAAASIERLDAEARRSLITLALDMLEADGRCPAPDASAGASQSEEQREKRILTCLTAELGRGR